MRLWNVQMRVLYCDSQINGEVTFNPGEQVKLEPKGGGGTSFAPVMKEVMRGAPTTCLIYFTDLCCSTFGEDPGCPVLWVQHGADGFLANYAQQPPFGEVIPMEQQHEDRRMVQTA
jgi:predicted metal-dependent peptidase